MEGLLDIYKLLQGLIEPVMCVDEKIVQSSFDQRNALEWQEKNLKILHF